MFLRTNAYRFVMTFQRTAAIYYICGTLPTGDAGVREWMRTVNGPGGPVVAVNEQQPGLVSF